MLTSAIPMAEYSIALRKRSSLSVMCLRSARKAYITMVIVGWQEQHQERQPGGVQHRPACWVVSATGFRAIISDTTITVTRNTRNASIRGSARRST
jgi:hypothetical protein